MLLGTLAANLLGNLLTGKRVLTAGERPLKAGQNFQCHFILHQILKCKLIIKMSLNLIVFIQEMIYLK